MIKVFDEKWIEENINLLTGAIAFGAIVSFMIAVLVFVNRFFPNGEESDLINGASLTGIETIVWWTLAFILVEIGYLKYFKGSKHSIYETIYRKVGFWFIACSQFWVYFIIIAIVRNMNNIFGWGSNHVGSIAIIVGIIIVIVGYFKLNNLLNNWQFEKNEKNKKTRKRNKKKIGDVVEG